MFRLRAALFFLCTMGLMAAEETFVTPTEQEIDFEYETLAVIEGFKADSLIEIPSPVLRPLTENTLARPIFTPPKIPKSKQGPSRTKSPTTLLHVTYYLPERYLSHIKGLFDANLLRTKVFVAKASSHFYDVTVHKIDTDVNADIRLFKIEALVPPHSVDLCVGQIVFIRTFIERQKVLTLMDGTLFEDKHGSYVWKKTEDGVEKVAVKVIKTANSQNVIRSGLSKTDLILIPN
ncbi:MAG: hypothetical protein A3F09_00355 [Chlamydiae bacterium RIFCSPHIGHO2_12_FULL_49_11]|nr:MAG: hypothetical protein A3F09_00355 [Chlamydiae bacterium RIFCSPHIGHO2_12_FULL_49_11]